LLAICFPPSLADSFLFLTLTRLVVVFIFVNFSFALFTPPSRRLSLFSQAADKAEANYYKRTGDKCDAGQCSKWNEVVVEDCATDDSKDELLIDCDSD
jgi:hypothetical protein